MRSFLIALTGIVALSFLAGVDDGLNLVDKARQADRIRIMAEVSHAAH